MKNAKMGKTPHGAHGILPDIVATMSPQYIIPKISYIADETPAGRHALGVKHLATWYNEVCN
jgi:hypothetical protein